MNIQAHEHVDAPRPRRTPIDAEPPRRSQRPRVDPTRGHTRLTPTQLLMVQRQAGNAVASRLARGAAAAHAAGRPRTVQRDLDDALLAQFDPLYEPSDAGQESAPAISNTRVGTTDATSTAIEGASATAGAYGMADLGVEIGTGRSATERLEKPVGAAVEATTTYVGEGLGFDMSERPKGSDQVRDEVATGGGLFASAIEALSVAGHNALPPVLHGVGSALRTFGPSLSKLTAFAGSVLSAVKVPLGKVILAVDGAHDAYTQWQAFSSATSGGEGHRPAEDAFGDEEGPQPRQGRIGRMLGRVRRKQGLRDEQALLTRSQTEGVAQYAAKKRFRGFVQSAFSAAMAVGRLIGDVLTFLGGSGAVLSLGSRLVEASRTGLNWVKGLYKLVRGTRGAHRTASTNELLDIARDESHMEHESALQLILDLGLFSKGFRAKVAALAGKKGLGRSRIVELQREPKSTDELLISIRTFERAGMLDTLGEALRDTMKSTA